MKNSARDYRLDCEERSFQLLLTWLRSSKIMAKDEVSIGGPVVWDNGYVREIISGYGNTRHHQRWKIHNSHEKINQ